MCFPCILVDLIELSGTSHRLIVSCSYFQCSLLYLISVTYNEHWHWCGNAARPCLTVCFPLHSAYKELCIVLHKWVGCSNVCCLAGENTREVLLNEVNLLRKDNGEISMCSINRGTVWFLQSGGTNGFHATICNAI